jgi:hypothetical protein
MSSVCHPARVCISDNSAASGSVVPGTKLCDISFVTWPIFYPEFLVYDDRAELAIQPTNRVELFMEQRDYSVVDATSEVQHAP